MRDLVSVCIPTYNNTLAEFKRTFYSILNQDYKKIKIIISDNFPKDKKKFFFIKKFKKKKIIIKYYKQKKYLKASENWDYVINKSDTKYTLIVGCNDEISKNYISKAVSFLERNDDYYAVAGVWIPNYEDKEFYSGIVPSFYYKNRFKFFRITKYVFKLNDNYINAVARTSVLKQVDFKRTVKNYWWPNKNLMANSYIQFLFSCLLFGKCTYIKSMHYVHNAPGWPKNKKFISLKLFFLDILKFYLRYLNLFFNFFIILLKKERGKSIIYLPILFVALIYNYIINSKKFLRKLKRYILFKKKFY